MTISVGDKIPEVTLVKATAEGPQAVKSSEYFAGKRVALFSVPGAFTPTCSAKHLPGFVEKASDLKAKGVDEIVGTAVNDAFVMGAWNKAAGSDDITMLADGNAEFVNAIGLTMDGSGFGMGTRGQRFSMVINVACRTAPRRRAGRLQGFERGAHARPALIAQTQGITRGAFPQGRAPFLYVTSGAARHMPPTRLRPQPSQLPRAHGPMAWTQSPPRQPSADDPR